MKRHKEERVRKLLITGGHAGTTALAVIQEIKKEKKPWQVFFIGAKSAFEGKSVPTLESRVLAKEGVSYYPIVTGRLQRRFSFWTVPSLLKIPVGFIQAFYYLARIRPGALLSLGGFTAVPVVAASFLWRVPIIIHEQTAAAGLANRLTSVFARKIALSRKESRRYFPRKKVSLVGLPLLRGFEKIREKKTKSPKTVFVAGGSRGSGIINLAVFGSLKELTGPFFVIHQTGIVDFEKAERLKADLSAEVKKMYQPVSLIDPRVIHRYYQKADIVICRAGANTVAEVIAVKRPALLIPIPWVYQNEQEKNAQFAQSLAPVRILSQDLLTPKSLVSEVNRLAADWARLLRTYPKIKSPDQKASARVVSLIAEYL